MTAPLSEARLAEIASTLLGEWLAGEWRTEYVGGDAEEAAYYRVKTSEGIVVATLPDWAGAVATLLADARTAVPELLAEVERLKAEAKRSRSRSGPRRDLLLATIQSLGGRWDVGRVKNMYAATSIGNVLRSTIRSDLRSLREAGHLVQRKGDGRQYHTLAGGAK